MSTAPCPVPVTLPGIRTALAGLLPIGATVTTLHVSTTRPRQGSASADVAVLVTAPDGCVVNVSALVARVTRNPKAISRQGVSSVRVLGNPGNPGAFLTAELAVVLHGSSTSLSHRPL